MNFCVTYFDWVDKSVKYQIICMIWLNLTKKIAATKYKMMTKRGNQDEIVKMTCHQEMLNLMKTDNFVWKT